MNATLGRLLIKVAVAAWRHGPRRAMALLVLGAVVFGIFSFGTSKFAPLTGGEMIEANAQVIKVRPYWKSRKTRIWVQYRYKTRKGRSVRSAIARYVDHHDAVKVGDRITIAYQSNRPNRTRVLSWIGAEAGVGDVAGSRDVGESRVREQVPTVGSKLPPFVMLFMALAFGWTGYRVAKYLVKPWLQTAKAKARRDKPAAAGSSAGRYDQDGPWGNDRDGGHVSADKTADMAADMANAKASRREGRVWAPAGKSGAGARASVSTSPRSRYKPKHKAVGKRTSKVKVRAGWFS